MSWWRRPWVVCLLLAVAVVGLWQIKHQDHTWPVGTTVPFTPEQNRTAGPMVWQADGYRYQALADFQIQARVLSRQDYSDRGAKVAPFDLALGWGVMSNQAVIDQLSISQSGRWYHYRWQGRQPPAPLDEIIRSSSNMHIIPGSVAAASALDRARKGSWVSLRGRLVRVDAADGWRWVSSLSRTDVGNGACELFWVDEAIVLDFPPG